MLKCGSKVNVSFNEADGASYPGIVRYDVGKTLFKNPDWMFSVRFIRKGTMYEKAVTIYQLSLRHASEDDERLETFEHCEINPWLDKPQRFEHHYRQLKRRTVA